MASALALSSCLIRNLCGYPSDAGGISTMAGLNGQQGVCPHKGHGHGHPFPVRQNHILDGFSNVSDS